MKINLSIHARKRMLERSISIQQIEESIEMPDYMIAKGIKIEAYKKFKEKTLKVVYVKEDSFIKIITLIWK